MKPRRNFLKSATAVSIGFSGLHQLTGSTIASGNSNSIYGPLQRDPEGILDLPPGFRYQVISRTGDRMTDGWNVSGKPDGMAAFDAPNGMTVVIRNHELALNMQDQGGPFEDLSRLPANFDPKLCYDAGEPNETPFFGGTSTFVYDCEHKSLHSQFQSLFGTDRNCAGGITPWGTWISCEEPETAGMMTPRGRKHGYCFEVRPTLEPSLQKPRKFPALGRFRHEAIAADPASGIFYLTEDAPNGLLYRFIPDQKGNLVSGKLQALVLTDYAGEDTTSGIPLGERLQATWADLDDVESPKDDLRVRGQAAGGNLFARGEGMWYGCHEPNGTLPSQPAIYWVCTTGGKNQSGQIWRYFPETSEVELYLEPNDHDLLQNGDNLTIAPWGDLIICEDAKKESNLLRGVTPDGTFYTLAANALNSAEFAGACFAPSHPTLFVNIQSPGLTLAITGPWSRRGKAT